MPDVQAEKVNLSAPKPPAPGEPGYVAPADAVPLPSQGKVYPSDHPLTGKQVVEIRSMTARDEDILTSPGLLKQGKAVTALLKACILNKQIDPDSLLVGDKNAILVAIRITGYGSEYKADVICPECEKKTRNEFQLTQLPIKPLGQEPLNPGANVFSFRLPRLKQDCLFKILTGADESNVNVTIERTKKAAGPQAVEPGVTTALQAAVLQIGEVRDPAHVNKVVQNLSAFDSRALRNHINKISPGIEMTQVFQCPHCEAETEVAVPLGTEFFWPSGS
ncbi:MAG: T4 family baseplate hub assembly chaperone [Acidiferrobacterales bacterium]